MLSQGLSPQRLPREGGASRPAAILVQNPWAQENPMVGACKECAHVLDQIRAIAATQPIGTMLARQQISDVDLGRCQRCPNWSVSAMIGFTLSPSRSELPAFATMRSPSRSPSRISISMSE